MKGIMRKKIIQVGLLLVMLAAVGCGNREIESSATNDVAEITPTSILELEEVTPTSVPVPTKTPTPTVSLTVEEFNGKEINRDDMKVVDLGAFNPLDKINMYV